MCSAVYTYGFGRSAVFRPGVLTHARHMLTLIRLVAIQRLFQNATARLRNPDRCHTHRDWRSFQPLNRRAATATRKSGSARLRLSSAEQRDLQGSLACFLSLERRARVAG